MSNTTDAHDLNRQALALAELVELAARDERLSAALATLDVTGLEGHMDPAGLRAALAEAVLDEQRESRTAEAERRAGAAGVTLAHRCRCGCSGINHDDRITDDGRIPCAAVGCACMDLEFAPA
ncbi:hypothetical protein [Streptomyces sp. NPDC087300]|uniref:hypothetical protein n=1 Tax=Streptomyces sp. NPDC087300 TaxID=3365780 RepID=UPI003813D69E